jgi:hypothetical protein
MKVASRSYFVNGNAGLSPELALFDPFSAKRLRKHNELNDIYGSGRN